MSVIVGVAWAEVGLLAGAYAFGLTARHGPMDYADTARAIHLTFATMAVLAMIFLALAIGAGAR